MSTSWGILEQARFGAVIAVCVGLFMSACAPSPQNLILGKWEVENAGIKVTAEFSRDGTARVTMFGKTIRGTYRWDAANELELTVNGRTTKSKAKVTATELELTDEANQTIKYKRD